MVRGGDLDEIRTTRGHPGRTIIAHLARIESLSRLREIAALPRVTSAVRFARQNRITKV